MKAKGGTKKRQSKIIHLKLTIYIITQITNEGDIYVHYCDCVGFFIVVSICQIYQIVH